MKSKAMLFLMVAILFWLPLASSSNSGNLQMRLHEVIESVPCMDVPAAGDCWQQLFYLMSIQALIFECSQNPNCPGSYWWYQLLEWNYLAERALFDCITPF